MTQFGHQNYSLTLVRNVFYLSRLSCVSPFTLELFRKPCLAAHAGHLYFKSKLDNELHDLSDDKILPTASFFHNARYVRFALALLAIYTSASMFREESPGEKCGTAWTARTLSVRGGQSVCKELTRRILAGDQRSAPHSARELESEYQTKDLDTQLRK